MPTRSGREQPLTAPIAIREEKLRVLVVESYPRWEYRYLRNALSRDPGVEVSCLLFHPGLSKPGGGNKDYIKEFPAGLDELSKFDVVFLGDVGTRRRPAHDRAVPADQGDRRAPGERAGVHARAAGAQALADGHRAGRPLPGGARPGAAGRLGLAHAQPLRADRAGPPQPPDQAGRHPGRQRRGLGGAARLPVVRPGAPRQGGQRRPLRPQGRLERIRPAAAAGHADLRGRQGPVHGDRRRLAVAQGGRGQVSLSVLGPGGALDGLPAEHGQGRDACGCTTCPTSRG